MRAIEDKSSPEDRKQHPVLGPVFRVRILSMGSRGAKGTARSTQVQGSRKKQAVTAPGAPADAAQAMGGQDMAVPASVSKSSACSYSSSDSETSERQKKNRKTKEKTRSKKTSKKNTKRSSKKSTAEAAKEKRAREGREKQEAKALEKQATARKHLAQQTLHKVNGPIATLEAALARPASLHLPQMVLHSASGALQALQDLDKEARLVLEDPKRECTRTLKEVGVSVQEAKKTEALVNQMLNTMRTLSGNP